MNYNILNRIYNRITFSIAYRLKKSFDINYVESLKSKVIAENAIINPSAKIYNLSSDRDKINIGSGSIIDGEMIVQRFGGNITFGENSYLGVNSRIWSAENIKIGNNVLIAHNVNIIDSNTHEINYKEREKGFIIARDFGYAKDKRSVLTSSIIIEDNVWISFNATILKGVSIGKGSIVAAGSVVTKDVAPFTMVAGVPAKKIKDL